MRDLRRARGAAAATAASLEQDLGERAVVVDRRRAVAERLQADVIRAHREALRVLEIPTRVMEKRPPTINLMKRVPNVLRSIIKLTWAIRVRG